MKYHKMQQSKFRLPVTATDATSCFGCSCNKSSCRCIAGSHRSSNICVGVATVVILFFSTAVAAIAVEVIVMVVSLFKDNNIHSSRYSC